MPSSPTAGNAAAAGRNGVTGAPENGVPGGTQSGQRLLTVLDQFTAERPTLTVEQLSQAVGVPRSTVYRLVGLLRAHGLVEQAGDGRYRLGPKAIMIGYVARSTVEEADLWR